MQRTFSRRAFVTALAILCVPLIALAQDKKDDKYREEKKKEVAPIVVKDSVPTTLLNVLINKMNIQLRENQKTPGIEVERTTPLSFGLFGS